MAKTKIEYLDYSWNPIAMRCSRVSKGCANCWHLQMCDRLAGNGKLSPEIRAAYAGEGPPILVGKRMVEMQRRRKPAMVGVQFMGDLFHRKVSITFVRQVWNVMAACQEHTFLILTKRARSMEDTVNTLINMGWPVLPNVQLGVSIEDQKSADERIPHLLRTPAAKRVVSVEPMLEGLDLTPYLNLLRGWKGMDPVLDWIIAGCESGPGRRSVGQEAFLSLRDQCVTSGTPFFLKQMEIDGKVVKMPSLEGQVWDLFPGEPVAGRS